jgi:hypothetical protein
MKQSIFILILGIVTYWGCTTESVQGPDDRISKISMSVQGLNDPGDSVAYFAWLSWKDITTAQVDFIKPLGPIELTGESLYQKSVSLSQGYVQGAEYILISMESNIEATTPGDYAIIAANLNANAGTFRIGHKQVLDYNFESANATFFLDTPTEDPPSANPTRGIWFAHYAVRINDITDSTGAVIGQDTVDIITPGLEVATLPQGWEYQAYVISASDSFLIGKFRSPEAPDGDKLYSGPNPGYLYPGEDFLTNDPAMPLDLRGKSVIVKMTPNYPDGSNMPYEVIVFKGVIPSDAQARTNYSLENMTDTWPSGQLQTEITLYQ